MSIKIDKNADNDFRQRRAFQRLEKSLATISSSPLTTKGDLFGFSTSNARIPVGADGTFLQSDSSSATGVSWKSLSAFGLAVYEAFGTTSVSDTMGGTNDTTERTFTLSGTPIGYTFGANTLTAASTWRITAKGKATMGATVATTFTPRVYFEDLGTLLYDPASLSGLTNQSNTADSGYFTMEILLRVLTVGVTGTISVSSRLTYMSANATTSVPRERIATVTVDTTLAHKLTLSGQWGAASASHSQVLNQYYLERIA